MSGSRTPGRPRPAVVADGKRIVLIEDEANIVELIRYPLPPEGFRVAPFRNYSRGGQVLASLKYLDPSFPGLQGLLDMYNRALERQSIEQNMTPEQKGAVEQLINYTTKMNRHR